MNDLYNIASLITLRKIKEIMPLYLFITATFFRVDRNIVIFSNRTNNTKWQFHYSSVLCMCRNTLHVNKIRIYDALHVVTIQCIDHVALLVLYRWIRDNSQTLDGCTFTWMPRVHIRDQNAATFPPETHISLDFIELNVI